MPSLREHRHQSLCPKSLEVSTRGYVMESGEITLSGAAKELLSDPKVRAAYLGESTS